MPTTRIHFSYVIGILVGLLVLVSTDRWTGQQNFTEFLTNAATMTSLVLGLVAIFYSFISNDGLSKSLGNISKVSEDITATRQSLAGVMDKSTELVEGSRASAAELRDISRSLDTRIGSLRDTMAEFKAQNETMNESLGIIPQRFDQLEAKMSEASSTPVKQSPPSSDNLRESSKLADKSFQQLSVAGAFAVYGAVLSHRMNKALHINEYQAATAISSATYMHGVLMTLSAVNLLNSSPVKGELRTLNIIDVNPSYTSLDTKKMQQFIEGKDQSDAIKSVWLSKIPLAEKFFSVGEV